MRSRINRARAALWLIFCCTLAACHPAGKDGTARLRVGEFLAATDSAQVTLTRAGSSSTFHLPYGALSDYWELAAGTYRARVTSAGQPLLDRSIGLGTGGSFTLLLTGTPLTGQETNEQAFGTTLHRFVEGSAAVTTNDYLPQLLIQNDYFIPVPGEGTLRITHLAPGVIPLDVSLLNDSITSATIRGLAYPHTSLRERVTAGIYRAAVHLGGSPLTEQQFPLELNEGLFCSLYLIPGIQDDPQPKVVLGLTKGK